MSGPANLYLEYLKVEGYVPRVDEDGDVVFKKEGGTYFIDVDESDPEFFRIVFPAFWDIETATERRRVERAAARTCARIKAGKVYPVRDDVWATVELFLAKPEDFQVIFVRAMRVLDHTVNLFAQQMQELQPMLEEGADAEEFEA